MYQVWVGWFCQRANSQQSASTKAVKLAESKQDEPETHRAERKRKEGRGGRSRIDESGAGVR